jgi:hypothetical protein
VSGHTPGDQLDLDAIEAKAARLGAPDQSDDGLQMSAIQLAMKVPALVAEVRQLRQWKAEALPVMDGLQKLGGALGLPLGSRITGREAVDAALDLRNKVEAVRRLADSMLWVRPDACPCESPEACCGSEDSCDAMQPSVKVVGRDAILRALAP